MREQPAPPSLAFLAADRVAAHAPYHGLPTAGASTLRNLHLGVLCFGGKELLGNVRGITTA